MFFSVKPSDGVYSVSLIKRSIPHIGGAGRLLYADLALGRCGSGEGLFGQACGGAYGPDLKGYKPINSSSCSFQLTVYNKRNDQCSSSLISQTPFTFISIPVTKMHKAFRTPTTNFLFMSLPLPPITGQTDNLCSESQIPHCHSNKWL